MPGVFFLNPERYMTPRLASLPGVRFLWSKTWIDETGFDIDAWLTTVGGKKSQVQITDRGWINKKFEKTFWVKKTAFYYCDPWELSTEGSVMLPAGHQVALTKDRRFKEIDIWTHRFKMDYPYGKKTQAEFNAHSVLWSRRELGYTELHVQNLKLGKRKGQLVCDTCPFRNTCEYAMKGSVCILPKSEAGVFARLIGSRNTEDVLAGLRLMVVAGGTRLEDAMAAEVKGEPSKEVTSLMNSVFNQAIALAKLQDPSLRASPKIQIGINAGSGNVTVDGSVQANNAEIASNLKELVDQGIPLDNITEELVIEYMDAKNRKDARAMKQIAMKYNIVDADQETSPF